MKGFAKFVWSMCGVAAMFLGTFPKRAAAVDDLEESHLAIRRKVLRKALPQTDGPHVYHINITCEVYILTSHVVKSRQLDERTK